MKTRLLIDIKGVPRPRVEVRQAGRSVATLHTSEVLTVKPGATYRIKAFPVMWEGWQYIPRRTGWREVRVKEGDYRAFTVRYRPAPIPWSSPPAGEFTIMAGLVNDARRDAGMKPVGYNDALALAAQRHAEDMAVNNYFSHVSLDGRTFEDRIRAVSFRGDPAGENIASGFPDAVSTFNGWMASEHHRTNVLNSEFDLMGLGYMARNDPNWTLGVSYWVQGFGYQPSS